VAVVPHPATDPAERFDPGPEHGPSAVVLVADDVAELSAGRSDVADQPPGRRGRLHVEHADTVQHPPLRGAELVPEQLVEATYHQHRYPVLGHGLQLRSEPEQIALDPVLTAVL